MTTNPFAALPRYSLIDGNMTRATSGDYVHVSDLAALAAAVPDDLADAGTVAEECFAAVNGEGKRACDWADKPHRLVYDLCRTIIALLARIAAQEARMKELETVAQEAKAGWRDAETFATEQKTDALKWFDLVHQNKLRAEAAETALAAMTKDRDELRACIAWVDEVYPARIEAGGAGIQITWEEFNAMQAAIGVTVDKRIGGPEGKAVHNHRLRAALAAERAKVARLVEAGNRVLAWSDRQGGHGIPVDAENQLRAAITEVDHE